MTRREIEKAANDFVHNFHAKHFPSDVNCIHCKGCNCPYNDECVWCGRSFAYYCISENGNNFETTSIIDELKKQLTPSAS